MSYDSLLALKARIAAGADPGGLGMLGLTDELLPLLRAPPVAILGLSSGPVDLTGTTDETQMGGLALTPSVIGSRGQLRCWSHWTYPNNANTKTSRLKLGGVNVFSRANTTSQQDIWEARICNFNSEAVQSISHTTGGGWASSTAAPTTAGINTALAQTLGFFGQLGVATDTLRLVAWSVELLRVS